MDANNLRQKDLVPIFGSESIVSEVLHRKRDLNRAHIEKLSKRFHVSPAVFFSRTTYERTPLFSLSGHDCQYWPSGMVQINIRKVLSGSLGSVWLELCR